MKRLALLAVSLAAAMAAGAAPIGGPPAQDLPQPGAAQPGRHLSDAEALGVAQAANNAEMQAAQAAQQKAKSDAVRGFAQKMLADHGRLQAQIAALGAAQESPASRDLGQAAQAQLQSLQSLSGDDFDRAYISAQVNDHRQVLSLLDGADRSGPHSGLLETARETVRGHLAEAERLEAQLGGR